MEKTTVTVDYKRFRELEELEKTLKEAKPEDGLIIKTLDSDNGYYTRNEIKVITGTEIIKTMMVFIAELQKSNGEMHKVYNNLYKVTPEKYRQKARSL